jgi:hypothetical protein
LPERPLYWEFYEGGFAKAVQFGEWKYIYSEKNGQAPKNELFNLKNDIAETKNLALENKEQLAIMENYSKNMHVKSVNPIFRKVDEK